MEKCRIMIQPGIDQYSTGAIQSRRQ